MREFKEEMRSFKNEMNKEWGWVINKLGTLEEDLFYPLYGGWSMEKKTVEKLSELGIYAMVVKGDIL